MAGIIVLTDPPGPGKSTVGPAVAAMFDRSVHLRADDVWPTIVSGFIELSLPEAHAQNTVVGDAVRAAAVAFADGGYTVVLDGVVYLWSLTRLIDSA